MNLQEVFDQLTYGELSQLSIGGGEAGVISPANYNRVLSHVNLGLMALYKRFLLKEGRITVVLDETRTDYPLTSKYAASKGSTTVPIFIQDIGSPFTDDIIKIHRIYGDSGFEYNLNNVSDLLSMLTPTATLLRVPQDILVPPDNIPEEMRTSTLAIHYRAKHPVIVPEGEDLEPEEIILELPETHLEPLLLFVASRAYTPLGLTNEANMGNTYFAKYENACKEIEAKDLQVDTASQENRILRNGWI